MSETEQPLEPVPVTKDSVVVNGSGDPELPPPAPELSNGIDKPVMDLPNSANDTELNGNHVPEGAPMNGDVNGDVEQDLLVDDLPPPPPPAAGVPDLPPPPPMEGDDVDLMMCDNDALESSVDPVPEPIVDVASPPVVDEPLLDLGAGASAGEGVGTSVDENVDTNVDQIVDNWVDQVAETCVDPIPECNVDQVAESSVDPIIDSNVYPVPETVKEPVPEPIVESVPEPIVDVVAPDTNAVESSVDPEVVDDQNVDENDELMNVSDNEETNEAVESSNVLVPETPKVVDDVSEEELVSVSGLKEEVEAVQNEVNEVAEAMGVVDDDDDEGTSVDADLPPAPAPTPAEVEANQEAVEEPVFVQQVPDPEPEHVVEESVPQQVEPVVKLGTPSHDVEVVETEEQPAPEPEQPQQLPISYAEPDIIVDNKPAEEVESPPPPPPPLVDKTPPPPPPSLDDSVPLRRVSGGSSPSKESDLSLDSPSPLNVAVVPPQPEVKKEQAAPVEHVAPIVQPVEPTPVPPTQPIAIVAPQVHMEPGTSPQTSPPVSPPGSPSSVSVEGDAQLVTNPQVSQKINKKNFKSKIKFGVDLVEASLKQLSFLKNVNNNSGLYEEWLYKKAIRRYEAFWLPLAAEHKKECLAAPLDIEWVWHCHQLAPLAYEADCKNITGILVDHKLTTDKDRTKSLEKSKKYWTAKYPKEPFEIELVYREKVVEEPSKEEAQPAESKPETPAEQPPPKKTKKGKASVRLR